MTRASRILLDSCGIRPGRRSRSSPGLLEEVLGAFSALPWENLTKYLRKERFDGEYRDGASIMPAEADGRPAPVGFLSRSCGRAGELFRFADTVMEEHVELGAGGTCFSLSNALGSILEDLGFEVVPVMGDMSHGRNIHCGLLVTMPEGAFLADPGYLVAAPVRVLPGSGLEMRNGPVNLEYSFSRDGSRAVLHTLHYGESGSPQRRFRYSMRLERTDMRDFMGHWLESFDSTGMRSLHLNMIRDGGRLSAHNENLRIDLGHSSSNRKLGGCYAPEVFRSFGVSDRVAREAYERWKSRSHRRDGGSDDLE